MSTNVKKRIFKFLRYVGVAITVLLLLLVIFIYALRFPAVQQYITQQALNYFQNKVSTEAGLERLYVDFPSNITLEGIYVEDQQGDTLLYGDYISVQTDLWELLDNKLYLSQIEMKGLVSNVKRAQ
ncbi:MAG: hypothetical protein R3345_11650, partial [Fulvivirga sp.]|nr:hypothetical protein [Fulvivirga sp.]